MTSFGDGFRRNRPPRPPEQRNIIISPPSLHPSLQPWVLCGYLYLDCDRGMNQERVFSVRTVEWVWFGVACGSTGNMGVGDLCDRRRLGVLTNPVLLPRQPNRGREGGLAVHQGDTGNDAAPPSPRPTRPRTYQRRSCKIVMPFCIPRHTHYVTRENKKKR